MERTAKHSAENASLLPSFDNRSETSSELMRVKVQRSFSQEDMLNEVTTRLARGETARLTLPLSEMAADAMTVFCFTEHRPSI